VRFPKEIEGESLAIVWRKVFTFLQPFFMGKMLGSDGVASAQSARTSLWVGGPTSAALFCFLHRFLLLLFLRPARSGMTYLSAIARVYLRITEIRGLSANAHNVCGFQGSNIVNAIPIQVRHN
jgi:hypothetical protein